MELSDKDFEEAIIKMLQYAIINFLETSKNIENVTKEIEITKNAITEIKKTHWIGSMIE